MPGGQLSLASMVALADSWVFPAQRSDKVREFGRTKAVLTTDVRHKQIRPSWTSQLVDGGRRVAEHAEVAFRHIAVPDRQHLSIGVSNDGLPGTVIVVFDREGRLLLKLDHAFQRLDNRRQSATRIRERTAPNDPAFARDRTSAQVSFVDRRGKPVPLDDLLRRMVGKRMHALRLARRPLRPCAQQPGAASRQPLITRRAIAAVATRSVAPGFANAGRQRFVPIDDMAAVAQGEAGQH